MMTAVQEREELDCSAVVVYGTVTRVATGTVGLIRLFEPGRIVAYRVRLNHRARLFVFRTLEHLERDATPVPGVQPAVRLLLVAHTARRIHRARQIFRALIKLDQSPDAVDDAVFVRAATALSHRVPMIHIVTTLVHQVPPLARTGSAARYHANRG